MTREIEQEPMSEDDMVCEFCGSPASWDVIDYADQINYGIHIHNKPMKRAI